jgi:hypothetical protein
MNNFVLQEKSLMDLKRGLGFRNPIDIKLNNNRCLTR